MSSSAQLFTIIAHRGASGSAPENTLAAIELAIANKADMIEIDIHQTKDGKLVVIHDDKLDRTTTGKGKINELTLEEIKKHDAGSWFNTSFSNEKVPELKEVLELINGKCKLLIEIKGKPSDYSGLEKN
jgi:glycerophosphoryl diester phosphodiesterase